ncbi:bifunctional (p)ppGpp synthetase/guanosine-3',5'-bis(diphosphate) 3'-pyrophosphohydrolase [Brumimicrobium glaciale]|uniref:Bifunctional (P)ppGpp synthetase/guanosine-3',5'-bis(Diphosphate) 3'-pyrophosphohydrolase n=1 Tax=Brumimicrobium glaciale TaxID=200475 RepID=A0A4V1WF67_9FLAO|nr:RelA/SpoT family protein [Brumimicrobium glaciale]RYM32136.1 bifunctional (p)ppGpp synthetase/guanosine-3',5'-bis(diphosphate) 3'-pyrophosphohydrolase [Brumimicrobium glaciale]
MENKPEIDLEKERKEILNAFRSLLRVTKNDRTREETKQIRKAFDVAVEAHKDMRRKSGEPYIYHPIAVAKICAEEMELGTTAIIAALLHDTVEDTYITLDDIEESFGKTVRKVIDGLTKIPEVFDENISIQAENFRKMILTISDDLRVVLIKLADRLHNMRTLDSMRPDKQLKIASETNFLYAPLAHRLGLYTIKSELEDLCLRYMNPQAYREISGKLKSTHAVRQRFIRRFTHPIKEALTNEGYIFDLKARTKSIASIYRKMKSKEIPFEEVFDLFAIRITLDTPEELEKPDCWRVYSIVTDFYQPNPDRLRDWVSTPRANGYESLHTTVMSPQGKWVEVQIRSERMDQIAEKGLAAHYNYKESKNGENKFDRWIGEIRELIGNHSEDAMDFVDEFKLNLFNDEIYVFTPNGELRVLPTGATTLDFAFDIHTDIGLTCIGAKVNKKLVPLSHQLKSGHQVEIITSSKQKPNEEWLKFAITGRAKQKIKAALNDERNKIAEDGKEILERKFKQHNIRFISENISILEKYYNVSTGTELYIRIAKGKVDLTKLRRIKNVGGVLKVEKEVKTNKIKHATDISKRIDSKKDTLVIGDDFKDIDYDFAKCCNPLPGDHVFGFITVSNGIKIHRNDCPNAENLMGKMNYRCISAKWKNQAVKEHLAKLKLIGIDDIGIVNKITEIVSYQQSVNMRSISFESKDGIFEGKIQVYVMDKYHLDELIEKFEMTEGIQRVERWDDITMENQEDYSDEEV